MAKLSKYEEGRRDGMDYAYRLVKEKGIEALERRVDRNRKTFAPAFMGDNSLNKFTSETKQACIFTFTCMMSMVMRDKYGFGRKRLSEFVNYFNNLADSIAGEWLYYNDIVYIIKTETGIDLAPYAPDAGIIINQVEQTVGERMEHKQTNGQI